MTFEEYYAIGENYYNKGEYRNALNHFKKCISLDDYYNCMDYIGLCYLHLKEYDLAAKTFKEIMNKCPKSAIPIINLGRVYLYQGLLKEAFGKFTRAVGIDPFDEDAYFYLGVYYDKIENYEEAAKNYKKSLSINMEQSETHLNLGICYYKLNFYNEALTEYDLAYKYDNECIKALENKSIVYIDLKDYKKALNELLIVIKTKPENIGDLIDITHCYYKLNDFQNAYTWIRKALAIDPKNEFANKMIERINSKLG